MGHLLKPGDAEASQRPLVVLLGSGIQAVFYKMFDSPIDQVHISTCALTKVLNKVIMNGLLMSM